MKHCTRKLQNHLTIMFVTQLLQDNCTVVLMRLLVLCGQNVVGLTKQFEWFKSWKAEVLSLAGPKRGNFIISNALYAFSTGSNDWVNNYYINPPLMKKYTPQAYTTLLLGFVEQYTMVGVSRITSLQLLREMIKKEKLIKDVNLQNFQVTVSVRPILRKLLLMLCDVVKLAGALLIGRSQHRYSKLATPRLPSSSNHAPRPRKPDMCTESQRRCPRLQPAASRRSRRDE